MSNRTKKQWHSSNFRQQAPQIKKQEIETLERNENQQFKYETNQLLDLAEKGLSEIRQLQQDYSYQQLNDCLDMDELETILDNQKKAESAINNKENTPDNLNDYLILNIQSFEKLEKMVESGKGKNKMAPAKEVRTEQSHEQGQDNELIQMNFDIHKLKSIDQFFFSCFFYIGIITWYQFS